MKAVLQPQGFTLIELILYLGIAAGVITSLTLFSLTIGGTRQKALVASEVQSNMRFANEIISQRIRAADGINIGPSTFGSDPGVLSLSMADASKDPTIIDLTADDGILRIKEGASAAVPLTTDEVKVTNFQLTDLSAAASKGNIRFELTIEFDNTSATNEFDFSQSTENSVSLRQ